MIGFRNFNGTFKLGHWASIKLNILLSFCQNIRHYKTKYQVSNCQKHYIKPQMNDQNHSIIYDIKQSSFFSTPVISYAAYNNDQYYLLIYSMQVYNPQLKSYEKIKLCMCIYGNIYNNSLICEIVKISTVFQPQTNIPANIFDVMTADTEIALNRRA